MAQSQISNKGLYRYLPHRAAQLQPLGSFKCSQPGGSLRFTPEISEEKLLEAAYKHNELNLRTLS